MRAILVLLVLLLAPLAFSAPAAAFPCSKGFPTPAGYTVVLYGGLYCHVYVYCTTTCPVFTRFDLFADDCMWTVEERQVAGHSVFRDGTCWPYLP